jgi:hypothetical protein
MEIRTEIEIAAGAGLIWAELMRFTAWPEWNPFIPRIEGKASPAERLTVRIQPPGRRPMTFRPKVLEVAEARTLRWQGKLLVSRVEHASRSL